MRYIVICLFSFVSMGCATTINDFDRAKAKCATNGGVAQISQKYNSTINVICVNGAKFKILSKEVNL